MRISRSKLCLVCVIGLMLSLVGNVAFAQTLWKYTDKDGKVTYSDKAPKPGEKAEAVDATPNSIEASKNKVGGVPQKLDDVKARAGEREKRRDALISEVNSARDEVARAKKALEDGREARPDERDIRVGRTKDGKPTGENSVMKKPEYYERIAALEDDVKQAEARLKSAEDNLRRTAP